MHKQMPIHLVITRCHLLYANSNSKIAWIDQRYQTTVSIICIVINIYVKLFSLLVLNSTCDVYVVHVLPRLVCLLDFVCLVCSLIGPQTLP